MKILKFAISGFCIVLIGVFTYQTIHPSNGADVCETPWASIGGCGAGGSGGGGGGAKWVGKGVSGGLVDLQVMYAYSMGQNFFNNTITPRFSTKIAWKHSVGVSIPVTSKIGEVQPESIFDEKYAITGGMGDIALDYSYALGMEGQYSIGLNLTLPTGQYDIKRGKDSKKGFLPASLQKGGGLYGAGASLGYTKDVEDGLWLFDVSYTHPMNMKLVTGENQFLDDYFANYKHLEDDERFHYRFKPYGETDLGGYSPPSLTLSAYYGYKGIVGYMHSWGITYSMPFGVAWIPSEALAADESKTKYNPRPDPDHQVWSATLNWGMEREDKKFPLFFAISLPIHDKTNAELDPDDNKFDPENFNVWDPPDMKDFLQQWTLSIGVKVTMF
ncbi:MAG: hypothetical protein GF398_06990 [Chitinivibrionales bacterium]|nr:hypothetical protein [Chitinivibrionales bacterium]